MGKFLLVHVNFYEHIISQGKMEYPVSCYTTQERLLCAFSSIKAVGATTAATAMAGPVFCWPRMCACAVLHPLHRDRALILCLLAVATSDPQLPDFGADNKPDQPLQFHFPKSVTSKAV